MLIRLEIKDFALISEAVFEPGNGLNVISGETGAGKSLLIDAIDIILGGKASKSLIRSDADNAFVEAVFDITDIKDGSLIRILDDNGIEREDDTLILSRKISRDGRSVARINGRTVMISLLRDVSSYLVNIHGQHDTQNIFDERSHVMFLDSYGHGMIDPFKIRYNEILAHYKDIILSIRKLSATPDQLERRKEYLEYAINEIDNADLKEGEEEALKERKKELSSLRNDALLFSGMNDLFNGNDVSDGGMKVKARDAFDMSRKIKNEDLKKRIEAVYYDIDALSSDISGLFDKMSFDPSEEEKIDKRIGLIYELSTKYGGDIKDILKFRDDASEELKGISDSRQKLIELKKERSSTEQELLKAAEDLSDIRKKLSLELSDAIETELKELEIPKARFSVDFRRRNKDKFFSSEGIDDISFLFSANPGQELKPLSETASGGEASRIMLAIKSILSDADIIPTLIFDEIDTGVSGKASNAISFKLKSISSYHQILCVTHTAQLAAAADINFNISKTLGDDDTSVDIIRLDEERKIEEVSRLMSGIVSEESESLSKKLIASFRGKTE